MRTNPTGAGGDRAPRASGAATGDDTVPEKRGHLCASCDGYLDGTEPGWICDYCVREWETWHRNERESHTRWVEARMRQTIGEVAM